MAERRVIADLEGGRLRLAITERSTVALEPLGLEFETIEDAWDHVTMYPLEFPSDLYDALLERLYGLAGQNQEGSPMTVPSEQQFNPLASNYASSHVHRAGASLPVMFEFAAPQPSDVMLDIATGTGNTALTFAPFVAHVTGVDLAVKMLEAARTRALEEGVMNVTFLEGSAEALPFEDASFDLVASRHAPHHFRDAAKFLHEVARVLKPNGRFVMADQVTLEAGNQVWVDEFQQTRDGSHFTQRTAQQWQELARAAGLGWEQQQIVPYRLEFAWWTQMAGCTSEQISRLLELLEVAPDEIQLERNPDGSPLAHTEPMLVVRLEKVD